MKLRPFVAGSASALLVAGALLVALPGAAQQAAPAQQPPQRERPLPSRHIEGRIAFMRAELKITPAQSAAWDRVAGVMRGNAQQMDQLAQQMRAARGQTQNAADKAEQRVRITEVHANTAKSFAEAFKPLYASLSDEQKKSADELFTRPMRGRGGHRRI